MRGNDSLTMKLRKILQDLEIASDHIDAILPDIYKEYGKDFCIYNIMYGYKDRLDEMYLTIGER